MEEALPAVSGWACALKTATGCSWSGCWNLIRLTKQTEGIMQMAESILRSKETLETKLIPLLGSILSTLEGRPKRKRWPWLDWDELYKDDPLMQPGPPEGELLANLEPLPTMPQRPEPAPPKPTGWLRASLVPGRTP